MRIRYKNDWDYSNILSFVLVRPTFVDTQARLSSPLLLVLHPLSAALHNSQGEHP